jgi:hypothetical protein
MLFFFVSRFIDNIIGEATKCVDGFDGVAFRTRQNEE